MAGSNSKQGRLCDLKQPCAASQQEQKPAFLRFAHFKHIKVRQLPLARESLFLANDNNVVVMILGPSVGLTNAESTANNDSNLTYCFSLKPCTHHQFTRHPDLHTGWMAAETALKVATQEAPVECGVPTVMEAKYMSFPAGCTEMLPASRTS